MPKSNERAHPPPTTSSTPLRAVPRAPHNRFLVAVALTSTTAALVFGLLWSDARRALDEANAAMAASGVTEVGPCDAPDERADCVVKTWTGTDIPRHETCDYDDDGGNETVIQYDHHGRRVAETYDSTGRGHIEELVTFDRRDVRVSKAIDKDGDDVFERMLSYDKNGREVRVAYDDDADGRFDRWIERLDGTEATWKDADADGIADRMEWRTNRVVGQELVRSPGGWLSIHPPYWGD